MTNPCTFTATEADEAEFIKIFAPVRRALKSLCESILERIEMPMGTDADCIADIKQIVSMQLAAVEDLHDSPL